MIEADRTLCINSIDTHLSNKLKWVGIVCALLIVALHTPIFNENGILVGCMVKHLQSIASMAVPCFFFVLGFLVIGHADEPNWYRQALIKRLRTLVVPFIAFQFIYLSILAFRDFVLGPRLGLLPALNSWGALSIIRFFGLDPIHSPWGNLWFLRSLIYFVVLSGVVLFILRQLRYAFIFCVVVLICVAGYFGVLDFAPMDLRKGSVYDILTTGFSLYGFVWFIAGIYTRLHSVGFVLARCWGYCIFIGAVFVLCANKAFLHSGLLHYILIVPLLIFGLFAIVPVTPPPRLLKGVAFPPYLIHWVPVYCGSLLVKAMNFSSHLYGVEWIIFYLAVICGSLGAIKLLKVLVPKLSNCLFGGR